MTYLIPDSEAEARLLLAAVLLLAAGIGLTTGWLYGRRLRGGS